jgi:hypothetical protein
MEWLALAMWVLVALVALPVGRAAFAAPPLGLVPPLALAGLVLSIVFAVRNGAALAWIATGLALAGAVLTGLGAAQLMEGEGAPPPAAADEAGAASIFAGVAWPFFAATAGVSLLAALAADGSI